MTLRAIDYNGFIPDEVIETEALANGSRDPHEDLANGSRHPHEDLVSGVTLMEKGWAILVVAVAAAVGVLLVLAVRT